MKRSLESWYSGIELIKDMKTRWPKETVIGMFTISAVPRIEWSRVKLWAAEKLVVGGDAARHLHGHGHISKRVPLELYINSAAPTPGICGRRQRLLLSSSACYHVGCVKLPLLLLLLLLL
jgi:hypothetical protein